MNRLMSLSAALAVAGATSLSAMDADPQSGALAIGNDRAKDYAFSWHGGFANKQLDQGWTRTSEPVVQTGATARYWGLGVSLEAAFAAGTDAGPSASFVANKGDLSVVPPATAPTVGYTGRSINPGECVQLNGKVDFLFQIDGVYSKDSTFLSLDPHLEWVTYPNQPANYLKDKQVWAGADVWWSTPLEGWDIGGSSDWNLQDPAYRGTVGMREILQYAPYDIVLWQLGNFGDRNYHMNYTGVEQRGWTTSQVGAKVRTPLAWRELWGYAGADWSYWLSKEERIARQTLVGSGPGDLVFTVGIEWRAE